MRLPYPFCPLRPQYNSLRINRKALPVSPSVWRFALPTPVWEIGIYNPACLYQWARDLRILHFPTFQSLVEGRLEFYQTQWETQLVHFSFPMQAAILHFESKLDTQTPIYSMFSQFYWIVVDLRTGGLSIRVYQPY